MIMIILDRIFIPINLNKNYFLPPYYIDMSFVRPQSHQQIENNQKQVMEDKSFPKCRLCNYRYFTRLDLCRHFVDYHLRAR